MRRLVIPLLLVLTPLAVLLLSARTVNAIGHDRDAELRLEGLRTQLVGLQVLPWDPGSRGLSQMWVRAGSGALKAKVTSELDQLERRHRDHDLARLRAAIATNVALADAVGRQADRDPPISAVSRLAGRQRTTFLAADAELRRAQAGFHADIATLELRRKVVGVLIVLALALSTGIAVLRSRRALLRVHALAAENAELLEQTRREARSDPLTGLANRRALYDELERRTAGEVVPFVLAMFDLDGFKALNDRYGHPAGDAGLVALADRLRGAEGQAFRLGGDEFCLLAADVEAAHAAQRALVHTTGDVRVTASLGLAVVPFEAGDASSALRLADARLYADKRLRRPVAA